MKHADWPENLARAVIQRAQLDLSSRRFIAWLRSKKGQAWLEMAGVSDPEQMAGAIARQL